MKTRMTQFFAASLTALMLGVLAAPAQAGCDACGVVRDVRTEKHKGEASGVGAVAGGVAGGLLGNMIGGGNGRTIATVAGVAGGAYAGHQVEKNVNSKVVHVVEVEMNNGKRRYFNFGNEPGFREGDKVEVVNGSLRRR